MSGIDRYTSPWSVNFNGSNALAHNTVVTCSFKDSDGNSARAKEIMLRFTADALWDGKIHIRCNNRVGGTAASATDFFMRAEDTARNIRFFAAEISIINIDASGGGLAAAVWIDAYSDEDITGTTFA